MFYLWSHILIFVNCHLSVWLTLYILYMFLRYFNYMVNQCEMRKEITMRVAFWTSSFLHRAKRMLNIAPKHHKKIMMDRVIPETRVSSCTQYWVWEAHFSANHVTLKCAFKTQIRYSKSGFWLPNGVLETLTSGFSKQPEFRVLTWYITNHKQGERVNFSSTT